MIIHNIHFNLSDRVVVFQGGYRQSAGPLPTLDYPLIGFWEHEGVLLKALFAVDRLPMHDGEAVLHRYEGPNISQHGQAHYRYFTRHGYGGMILSQAAYTRRGLLIADVFHHLTTEANDARLAAWQAEKPIEVQCEYEVIRVPDQLGNYADAVLILSVPREQEDFVAP